MYSKDQKTLTNVPFGIVRYPGKVQLRYCDVSVVVLFRYYAVNVQVWYKSGGRFGTIDDSLLGSKEFTLI